jgi:hypothetical protein
MSPDLVSSNRGMWSARYWFKNASGVHPANAAYFARAAAFSGAEFDFHVRGVHPF